MSYRVLRQLPSGGFSDLFEVEDPASALPERLILKRLNSAMSARPAVRAAFADEAKILRELKHPSIVTFRRCYFDENQRVCLLMEKVVGEPLDAWAKRAAGRPEVVLDLFDQVLQAVDYLHHRPVPFLHLDLKPDNVLVASGSQVPQPVLIDFGIARRSGQQGLKAYTPPYGAPEQEAGGALDCSTDVFALGQILLELLVTLSTLGDVPRQALAAVAEKATSRKRRERFPDAGAMRLGFRSARRIALKPKPGWSVNGAARLSPASSRRFLFVGGGVLGMVVLVVVGVASFTSDEPHRAMPEQVILSGEALEPRFDDLVLQAREATREGHFDRAEQIYREARLLIESTPAEKETSRVMERELAALRSQIDLVRHGGVEGERVRLEMK
jgi:serine/threonine protein kinase